VRESFRVDVGGVELACRTEGEAGLPAVVLLHSLGEDGRSWTKVVEAVATTYRVVAPDLRGHGASSHPGTYSLELMCSDVLGILDALDLDEVRLIGHSLGAAVAYLVAESNPARIRRLVLEEPPPPLPAIPPREVPTRPVGALSFDWEMVEAITRQRNQPDSAWWDDLAGITSPTLVIAGGPTSHLPQDQIAAMASRIPGATSVTIDTGHNVHATQPDAFLAALLPFLAG